MNPHDCNSHTDLNRARLPIPPFLHIKLLCCPAADKAYNTTTTFKCQHFFLFFKCIFLYFFEKLLTLCLTLVSFLLVGNINDDTCGRCRNWQTSKTKDLVTIAVVWVQVPSSALFNLVQSLIIKASALFLFLNCLNTLEHVHIRHFATDCRFVGRYSIFQRFRCKM